MQAAKPAISGAQIRAARAFLRWSVQDLSQLCGVSESAIARAEKFDAVPGMRGRNLDAIRAAFEMHGIEFIDRAACEPACAEKENPASDRALLPGPERRAQLELLDLAVRQLRQRLDESHFARALVGGDRVAGNAR